MKISFDVGGVISRYPDKMRELMGILKNGGAELFVLTDMNPEDAYMCCDFHGITDLIGRDHIILADWSSLGEMCKSEKIKELEIDIHIDDFAPYCAEGDFIGMVLAPRPRMPFCAEGWLDYLKKDL